MLERKKNIKTTLLINATYVGKQVENVHILWSDTLFFKCEQLGIIINNQTIFTDTVKNSVKI